jgi:ubiquinone/menaquinone biosynthesis C-methylase UbiE
MIDPQQLLTCPETHQPLKIDRKRGVVSVEGSNMTYPIKDGIIDFIPDVNDDGIAMFDAMAEEYDDWMNSSNMVQKLSTWFTWGFMDDRRYANWLLTRLPDDFDGVLLDVPCGTGILALEKYKKLKRATIIALDYSIEMLRRARENFQKAGLQNVILVRADAARLPVSNGVVDHCLSINGFHIYLDKQKALDETVRVLKPGADFSGCFCVKGLRFLSDVFIRKMNRQNKTGSNFLTLEEVYRLFGTNFEILSEEQIGALLLFHARRKM